MVRTRLAPVLILTLALGVALGALAQMTCPNPQAMARRAELLKLRGDGAAAIEKLTAALGDRDPLVRHTAARLLGARGEAALPALAEALKNRDALVRRTAAVGLGGLGPQAVEPLAGALADESPYVRHGAVLGLARVRPSSPRVIELLTQAGRDESALVSEAALKASKYAFTVLDSIRLPREGWKFTTDPERVGEERKWFAADFDDSGWAEIEIEKAWTQQGYNYIGWSWYRRTIDLPAREAAPRVVMAFEGVDESAWLWVNGQYVGAHDIGPTGWDKPFQLEITDQIRWGQPNQITVRAMNTAAAGGIWLPVHIMVLEPAQ